MTEQEAEKGNELQTILKGTESVASNYSTTNTLHCESASKKRKVMKERSVAWGYIDKFNDDEGIKKVRCNHKGQDLASDVAKCLLEWGLDKFFTVTVDHASSNDVMVKELSKQFTRWNTNLMEGSLKKLMENEDVAVREIAKNMKEKFDKYWGDPHKMNKMIFISCVLDPRQKFHSLSFALAAIFGETKGVKIQEEVKTYMKTLFSEYVKMNDDSCPSSPSSTSSSCPSPPSSPYSCSFSSSFSKFMLDLKRHKSGGAIDSKTELDKYLGEDVEEEKNKFDVLGWWKLNSPRFPTLADMARDVLAIPISSVASESAFSTGGRILDPFRSSLTPRLVQDLVCVQDWLRNESTTPVKIEEDLDNLEQLELEIRGSSTSGIGRDIEVGTL
ncbi:zinc finger BED domain-containing protein RICESLEEPER 2-like [Nicotiana tabacum]|uniref:Zinc finger BED domain-containing protein RICESLEEPER 2-like n=1 Tax=Nicotiana tabacum TaxID=4097 RepID=A0AC58TE35_TOBAC